MTSRKASKLDSWAGFVPYVAPEIEEFPSISSHLLSLRQRVQPECVPFHIRPATELKT